MEGENNEDGSLKSDDVSWGAAAGTNVDGFGTGHVADVNSLSDSSEGRAQLVSGGDVMKGGEANGTPIASEAAAPTAAASSRVTARGSSRFRPWAESDITADAPQPPPQKRNKRSKWDNVVEKEDSATEDEDEEDEKEALLPDGAPYYVYAAGVPLTTSDATLLGFLKGALLTISGIDVPISVERCGDEFLDLMAGTACHKIILITRESIELCLNLSGIKLGTIPIHIGKEPTKGPVNAAGATPTPGALNAWNAGTTDPAQLAIMSDPLYHRLHISDLPLHLPESHVRDMLEQFGTLAEFTMCKEQATGLSRGTAYCEYEDPSVTEVAIQALHGSVCSGKQLRLHRVAMMAASGGAAAATALAASRTIGTGATGGPMRVTSMTKQIFSNPVVGSKVRKARKQGDTPSQVVQLLNVVFPEDLSSDVEYQAILEDMQSVASKFGSVSVVIPRPSQETSYTPGVGKVFLHYNDMTSARKARWELNGRRYDSRRVTCAAFYPLETFQEGKYVLF